MMGRQDIQVLLLALLRTLTFPTCKNAVNAFMFFIPVWFLKG